MAYNSDVLAKLLLYTLSACYLLGVALVVQATKDIILLSMRGSDWGSRYDDTKLVSVPENAHIN